MRGKSARQAQNADSRRNRIEFRVGIHVGDIIIDDNDFLATASTSLPGSRESRSLAGSHLRRRATAIRGKVDIAFDIWACRI
jgi:hypothetical protein